jgi:thiosulfate dehydrogenase
MHLRQFATVLILATPVTLAGCSIDRRPPQTQPAGPTLPDGSDPFSVEVRRGAAILGATRDSLPGHVGNGLRCTSCHLDGGTREVLGWRGAYARFPQYRARSGTVQVIEDRVNDCLERSLNGKRLPADTAPMKAIVSYLAWMSRDVAPAPGTSGPKLIAGFEELVPDTAAGRAVYEASCARCHGEHGAGTALATPVWGPRAYNIGAGMARYRSAAAFIQANMPHDLPGTLDRQQAIDVAGYINGHPRPEFAGTRNDWPRGDAPGDAPYPTHARP